MRSIQTKPTKEEKKGKKHSFRLLNIGKEIETLSIAIRIKSHFFSICKPEQPKKEYRKKANHRKLFVEADELSEMHLGERMKKRKNFHLWRSKWNFNDEKQLELQAQATATAAG